MKTKKLTDRPTREQRDAQASPPHADDVRRMFNNMVGFWRVCEKPGCRRNHACSGEMHACFNRFWRLVPEESKEYVRGCIRAAQHTRVAQEIDRAGIAAHDAYLKDAEPAATLSTTRDATPSPGEVPAEAEVRLRRL